MTNITHKNKKLILRGKYILNLKKTKIHTRTANFNIKTTYFNTKNTKPNRNDNIIKRDNCKY